MARERKGTNQARKDIVAEVKPKGIDETLPWEGGDNYKVTATHLFTKEQKRLNRELGL